MQIMVAENGDCGITELSYKAQCLARFRAPIDKVAGNPQSILGRIKGNFVEQPPKRIVASLQIAYRVLSQLLPCPANKRKILLALFAGGRVAPPHVGFATTRRRALPPAKRSAHIHPFIHGAGR
jgi:hypothetical protein